MHALHLSALYWPHRGGAEMYLQEISERLVREGNLVTVVTSDAATVECFWSKGAEHLDKEQECHNGVEIYRCPVYSLPGSPWSFYALRRLAMAISDLPLDTTPLLQRLSRYMPWMPTMERILDTLSVSMSLVQGVNLSFEYPVIVAWRYARAHGLPFVLTPLLHLGVPGERTVVRHHTMRHQLQVLRESEAIITLTHLESDYLIKLGVEDTRVYKVGVGVNPCQLEGGDAQRFRDQYGLKGPIVAFLGSITYDKGATHLIQAMQRLWARGMDAELVLAGTPLGSFKRYYHGLPEVVRNRIRLLESIEEGEKRDLLSAAALLAMPSRVDAFGIAYLEAWTHGKPVIGARAGGVPEVIEEGRDGLLVPFGDIPRLADSLATLLTDEVLAQQMGERGREKVMRYYTWDIVYQRVKAIYEELLR